MRFPSQIVCILAFMVSAKPTASGSDSFSQLATASRYTTITPSQNSLDWSQSLEMLSSPDLLIIRLSPSQPERLSQQPGFASRISSYLKASESSRLIIQSRENHGNVLIFTKETEPPIKLIAPIKPGQFVLPNNASLETIAAALDCKSRTPTFSDETRYCFDDNELSGYLTTDDNMHSYYSATEKITSASQVMSYNQSLLETDCCRIEDAGMLTAAGSDDDDDPWESEEYDTAFPKHYQGLSEEEEDWLRFLAHHLIAACKVYSRTHQLSAFRNLPSFRIWFASRNNNAGLFRFHSQGIMQRRRIRRNRCIRPYNTKKVRAEECIIRGFSDPPPRKRPRKH